MSKIKFQHYVPRFYLERFQDRNGMVWVFDKKEGKVFCTKAENIGGERHFYDTQKYDEIIGVEQFVEKFFHPFEGKAACILSSWLDKLEKGAPFQIETQERQWFAAFLATQLIRTPKHRSFIMQMGALFKKLELQAHLDFEHPEVADIPFEITWDKAREPYVHAKNMCDKETIEEYANILESHIWVVVSNPTNHTLFTSDNPVIKKANVRRGWKSYSGIASEGIQLIFPLSPRFSLSLLERHYWKKCEQFDGGLVPFSMEDANVDHDNSGQVEYSTRFIFCSENDFDLARRFCAEFPDVRNPERPLVEQI